MADPSSDASKYFPFAHALQDQLDADAVFLLVVGGTLGNGACPALRLSKLDSPEARQANSRLLRSIVRALSMVAERLEADIAATGIPLEAAS